MTDSRSAKGLPGLLLRLFGHLSARRRRQMVVLLLLMFASAVAEVVSLGAVLPFIAALTAPDRLLERSSVRFAADLLGVAAPSQLVLPLTIAFVAAALVAAAIRLTVLWVSSRVAFGGGTELSIKAYRRTLYQPYQTHIARNSGAVISGIVDKVNGATAVLLVLLNLLSATVFLTIAVITLIALQPLIAGAVILGFGLAYALIFFPAKRILSRNSARIAAEQTRVIQALQEGLGAIRDVILDGTQEVYCRHYQAADVALRDANARTNFIGQSPRFATEALGTVTIAIIAYAFAVSGSLTAALPTLALLALGAQRVLPALQQAYASWVGIAGSESLLTGALALLDQETPPQVARETVAPLGVHASIALDHVTFTYDGQIRPAVEDICLRIPKGARVGLVGLSGSGKSTLMDLMLGLLEPRAGQLLVDGKALGREDIKHWQRSLAHVPQAIFIADATIAENIAFAVGAEEVDTDWVRKAAAYAQLDELIDSKPRGLATQIGERGSRLSGGQRQRIGLARAIYKRASVLFLDEPTAALDSLTERSVLKSLERLQRDLTVIIIAHRLSTVRDCDMIFEIEDGRIVASGTYDELLEKSESFRRLAVA